MRGSFSALHDHISIVLEIMNIWLHTCSDVDHLEEVYKDIKKSCVSSSN